MHTVVAMDTRMCVKENDEYMKVAAFDRLGRFVEVSEKGRASEVREAQGSIAVQSDIVIASLLMANKRHLTKISFPFDFL